MPNQIKDKVYNNNQSTSKRIDLSNPFHNKQSKFQSDSKIINDDINLLQKKLAGLQQKIVQIREQDAEPTQMKYFLTQKKPQNHQFKQDQIFKDLIRQGSQQDAQLLPPVKSKSPLKSNKKRLMKTIKSQSSFALQQQIRKEQQDLNKSIKSSRTKDRSSKQRRNSLPNNRKNIINSRNDEIHSNLLKQNTVFRKKILQLQIKNKRLEQQNQRLKRRQRKYKQRAQRGIQALNQLQTMTSNFQKSQLIRQKQKKLICNLKMQIAKKKL